MIELVFAVCSLLEGNVCTEKHLTFSAEAVSLHQCMTGALPVIAQWQADHPNWTTPRRWKCQLAGQYAKA